MSLEVPQQRAPAMAAALVAQGDSQQLPKQRAEWLPTCYVRMLVSRQVEAILTGSVQHAPETAAAAYAPAAAAGAALTQPAVASGTRLCNSRHAAVTAWLGCSAQATIASARHAWAASCRAVMNARHAESHCLGESCSAVNLAAGTLLFSGRPIGLVQAGVISIHAAAKREVEQRREEARRRRLHALRSSDMQGYLALVRETRSSRLQDMLQQTDKCLRSFAAKLGLTHLLSGLHQNAVASDQTALEHVTVSMGDGVVAVSDAWSQLASRLQADIATQPAMLQGGQLRDYQLHGLRWMVALHDAGLNGILADDMGLGKTVQVIALICHLLERAQKQAKSCAAGPFLIAAPASVLPNWAAEFQRWAPDIKVIVYRGGPAAREALYLEQIAPPRSKTHKPPFHVLLTTYDFLMGKLDKPRLSKLSWCHIIIDEGHRLKDATCKLSQALALYRAKSRLLLTGTPLQNNLSELWALLHFLMPGTFGDAQDFEQWFSAPLEALRSASGPGGPIDQADTAAAGCAGTLTEEEFMLATNRLHQVLRPFVLRRLIGGVAGELPGKEERLVRCVPSAYQTALTNMVRQQFVGSKEGPQACVGARPTISVHNTLMELRKIANHPFLSVLHPPHGDEVIPGGGHLASASLTVPALVSTCGKMDVLDRLLLRLHQQARKVLVFSTMTSVLDLVEELLQWRGLLPGMLRLDGNTHAAERGALIKSFNDTAPGSPWLFLLSLRAGGVGLNLQAADTIIMLDTDFNPQADLQAQARAYRIGQQNKVLVLRLVTSGSVEEHILRVAQHKRRFADSSITGGFFDQGTTSDQDRRAFLVSLLQEAVPHAAGDATTGQPDNGKQQDAPGVEGRKHMQGLTDADLNELLRRGKDTDQQAPMQCKSGGKGCRLLTEAQLQPLISLMQGHNTALDPDAGKLFGRGMRRVNSQAIAVLSAANAAPPGCTQAANVVTVSTGHAAQKLSDADGPPCNAPEPAATIAFPMPIETSPQHVASAPHVFPHNKVVMGETAGLLPAWKGNAAATLPASPRIQSAAVLMDGANTALTTMSAQDTRAAAAGAASSCFAAVACSGKRRRAPGVEGIANHSCAVATRSLQHDVQQPTACMSAANAADVSRPWIAAELLADLSKGGAKHVTMQAADGCTAEMAKAMLPGDILLAQGSASAGHFHGKDHAPVAVDIPVAAQDTSSYIELAVMRSSTQRSHPAVRHLAAAPIKVFATAQSAWLDEGARNAASTVLQKILNSPSSAAHIVLTGGSNKTSNTLATCHTEAQLAVETGHKRAKLSGDLQGHVLAAGASAMQQSSAMSGSIPAFEAPPAALNQDVSNFSKPATGSPVQGQCIHTGCADTSAEHQLDKHGVHQADPGPTGPAALAGTGLDAACVAACTAGTTGHQPVVGAEGSVHFLPASNKSATLARLARIAEIPLAQLSRVKQQVMLRTQAAAASVMLGTVITSQTMTEPSATVTATPASEAKAGCSPGLHALPVASEPVAASAFHPPGNPNVQAQAESKTVANAEKGTMEASTGSKQKGRRARLSTSKQGARSPELHSSIGGQSIQSMTARHLERRVTRSDSKSLGMDARGQDNSTHNTMHAAGKLQAEGATHPLPDASQDGAGTPDTEANAKKRKRGSFSDREVHAILDGLLGLEEQHRETLWASIKDAGGPVLARRSIVDLADKWRNLLAQWSKNILLPDIASKVERAKVKMDHHGRWPASKHWLP